VHLEICLLMHFPFRVEGYQDIEYLTQLKMLFHMLFGIAKLFLLIVEV